MVDSSGNYTRDRRSVHLRLPVHLYETISRIKENNQAAFKKWVKPTEEEIATRMEMTIEKLRFIAKSAQLPISLETPIGRGRLLTGRFY